MTTATALSGTRVHARRARELRRVRTGPIAPVSFLETASPEHSALLLARAELRRAAAGTLLVRQGRSCERVVLLRRGTAKIFVRTPARDVMLGLRGAGEFLSDTHAGAGRRHPVSALALEDAEIALIDRLALREFLLAEPAAALHLVRVAEDRLEDADRQRLELASLDTFGRLCARLVELAERTGRPDDTGVLIAAALSQDDLAGWIGASRKAVTSALQRLRALGWIETGRRRVVVHDLPALRRAAAFGREGSR